MRIKKFNISVGAQLFKALSDESRLRILHLLHKNKRMCISDIELILDFTQTKTSRHLIYLKNSNIVKLQKVDQYAFYSLSPGVIDFIDNVTSYFKNDITLANDQKNFDIMYANRGLRVALLELQRRI